MTRVYGDVVTSYPEAATVKPLVEPLLPEPPPKQVEGRSREPDRQALCKILFVLHTGIQWEYLPQELGFGSGMTGWRRLAPWNDQRLGEAAPAAVEEPAGLVRAVIDSSHVRATCRGPKAGPARSTAHGRAVGNDVTQLLPRLQKIPPVAGVGGRPRRRPDILFTDRGYDRDKYRRLMQKRGIRPVIAERGQPHGTSLGTFRWVVERTISWLHGFRRLRNRWERRDDIHEAFLGLAPCLITYRHVQRRLASNRWLRGSPTALESTVLDHMAVRCAIPGVP